MTTVGRFVGAVIVLFGLAGSELLHVTTIVSAKASAARPSIDAGNPCSMTQTPMPKLPYYAIKMVKTGRVPRTGRSRGIGHASFVRSPFGVSITRNGTYIYDLTISFESLKAPNRGNYTVWVTNSEVDQVKQLGILDSNGSVSGRVEWNKYLVVLTLELEDNPAATMWSGPIVSRGMSRSGMMHTLAGHGPYENEPCAKYGFGENPRQSTLPR